MIQVDEKEMIRKLYYRQRLSMRQIARERRHSRETVKKAVMDAGVPQYRLKVARPGPVLGPYRAIIDRWLEEDKHRPRKQRHTGHRIYERLVKEHGFCGGESTVRHYVGQGRKGLEDLAIPLEFDPGTDAQCDWGEAQVIMKGQSREVELFCMKLCYSHKPFVMAFPSQRQEAFFQGHAEAFLWYGGVPPRISYDNLKTAIRKVLPGRNREEQTAFTAFRSHYLFETNFATPGRPQEQGRVESLVGYARRNFLVPIPEVVSFEELNQMLLERLGEEDQRRVSGEDLTIGELWQKERPKLLPLPRYSYPCCITRPVRANRLSLVTFDGNHYSVPVEYAPRKLTLHAYTWRVEIAWRDLVLAVHERCYDKGQDTMEVEHYLPLLLQRPGAFPYAKPVRRWDMPLVYKEFLTALKERHRDGQGIREFLRILGLGRLCGTELLEAALSQGLARGWISYEGVRQLLPERNGVEATYPAITPSHLAHLQGIKVVFPSLSQFDLLRGRQ